MALILRFIFILFLLYLAISQPQQQQQQEFTEELLIKPLPDRKILSHFHFETRVPPADSFGPRRHLFPKTIYQLFLGGNSSKRSPMISGLQELRRIKSYTEVVLVPLTTPDFSMPYNVITITCTVFALYFVSLLNTLRQRVARKKDKATKKTCLFFLLSRLSAKLRGRSFEPHTSLSSSSSTTILSLKYLSTSQQSPSLLLVSSSILGETENWKGR